MAKVNGPTFSVKSTCDNCAHETSVKYGYDNYCNHPAASPGHGKRLIPFGGAPEWCPFLARPTPAPAGGKAKT